MIIVSWKDHSTGQAYSILRAGFALTFLITGLDKFLGVLLVDWERYLAPQIAQWLPITPHAFMLLGGAFEIFLGLWVAFRPHTGALAATFALWAIIANLLIGGFYDIALRDFGLSLGALALFRLASAAQASGSSKDSRWIWTDEPDAEALRHSA